MPEDGHWEGGAEGAGERLEASEAPRLGNWALGTRRGHSKPVPGHLGASCPHAYPLEQTEGVLMPKRVVGLPAGTRAKMH